MQQMVKGKGGKISSLTGKLCLNIGRLPNASLYHLCKFSASLGIVWVGWRNPKRPGRRGRVSCSGIGGTAMELLHVTLEAFFHSDGRLSQCASSVQPCVTSSNQPNSPKLPCPNSKVMWSRSIHSSQHIKSQSFNISST